MDTDIQQPDDFRSIITRSKATPNQLENFTKVQYQTRPDYIRDRLYGELRQQQGRSQSSSLINKKNLLKMKRSMGREAQSKSILISQRDQSKATADPYDDRQTYSNRRASQDHVPKIPASPYGRIPQLIENQNRRFAEYAASLSQQDIFASLDYTESGLDPRIRSELKPKYSSVRSKQSLGGDRFVHASLKDLLKSDKQIRVSQKRIDKSAQQLRYDEIEIPESIDTPGKRDNLNEVSVRNLTLEPRSILPNTFKDRHVSFMRSSEEKKDEQTAEQLTHKTTATPVTRQDLSSKSPSRMMNAIFATNESRENLSNDYLTVNKSATSQERKGLKNQVSQKVINRATEPFVAHQDQNMLLKQNQSLPHLQPQKEPQTIKIDHESEEQSHRLDTMPSEIQQFLGVNDQQSNSHQLKNVVSEAHLARIDLGLLNRQMIEAERNQQAQQRQLSAMASESALKSIRNEMLPHLKWDRFMRSKAAEYMRDPMAQLNVPSQMSQQTEAKKKLKHHIMQRNQSFEAQQNPIIGDVYEMKLKQLEKNVDLAQEGKLSYELFDESAQGQADQTHTVTVEPSEISIQDKYWKKNAMANKVLDTSVLVKPSQIHPEIEKYLKMLEVLRREDQSVNRLGVPVPLIPSAKNHHKKNLKNIKTTFRQKNTTILYPHEELKQTPFEKLEEESKVAFNTKKLPAEQRENYERMDYEHLAKNLGEPYDVAKAIFAEFETDQFRAKRLRDDLTAKKVLFAKKLDVMNEEFDTYIGALVADLIFKQHTLRSQTKQNLEKVDNYASSQFSRMLVEDLRRTEHLVYVDTSMNITDQEQQAIKDDQPIDYEKLIKRRSQIAEKAHGFLKKLKVPIESMFSKPNYLQHLKVKTRIIQNKEAEEQEEHPMRPIKPVAPGQRTNNLEPVVVGGVAFYLDHENQMVIPMEPVSLPSSKPLSKSNSHANLSKTNSRISSVATTPNIKSPLLRSPNHPRMVSFNNTPEKVNS